MGRVVINPITPEEFQKFVLIIPLLVMLRLVLDIFNDVVRLRRADTERAVTFLSRKIASSRAGVIEPFRGATLEGLNCL